MASIKECFKSRFPGGKIIEVDFCLHPDTKVLTHDFIYKPIGDVVEGECLIGFEETLRNYNKTQFKKATVLKTKRVQKEAVKLGFCDGTSVICSTDHQWVACDKSIGNQLDWYKTETLDVGDYIPQVVEVWDDLSNTPDGAWMAGFMDGEGWVSKASSFGVGQNYDEDHKCIWDKLLPILDKDFSNDLSFCPNKRCKVIRVRANGLRTAWKMVGMYQPVRLKRTLQNTYEGTILRSKRNRKKWITSKEYLGVIEVVALETDTHTYIAEGMPSHNCQLEVIGAAIISGDKMMKKDILDGIDSHSQSAAWLNPKYTYEEVRNGYLNEDLKFTKMRKNAKAPRFELQYGAGAKSIAENNNITVEAAQGFIDAYYERYKDLKLFQEDVKYLVELSAAPSGFYSKITGAPYMRGQYVSCTGRRYTFLEQDAPEFMRKRGTMTSFSPTQMKNYPIQGFATGDIVPHMLGVVHSTVHDTSRASSYKCLPINTIHDAILFDCGGDIDYWCTKLKAVLENTPFYIHHHFGVHIDLPMSVDVEIGDNWEEMKKWKSC